MSADMKTGLSSKQAAELQKKYGKNELADKKEKNIFFKIIDIFREPMFLLLIAAALIYFVLGEPRDGAIMLIFVIAVIGIESYQEWKTEGTLNALKNLSAPAVTVIRDGVKTQIHSADLVPGDVMLLAEGEKIAADGNVLAANDLCVDESSLTGESEGIWKTVFTDEKFPDYWRRDRCYAGTLVTQGSATVLVDKIGGATEYGKIGVKIAEAPERPTPLEKQVNKVVRVCAFIAVAVCLIAVAVTWFDLPDHRPNDRIIESILSGITLAMAMIPEEFPVVLVVFLSMGAWRLAKKQSLIRRLPAVETLGAISVLCVDKTGTITQNQMAVRETWSPSDDLDHLHETMGLACETDAYDPMEQAMLRFCEEKGIHKEHLFESESRFISEYAFTNEAKMMGHVWVHEDQLLVAAKGSPESILPLCGLSDGERQSVDARILAMSGQGLRVIAVASAYPSSEEEVPAALTECRLTFAGLVGLADPPRERIEKEINLCRRAGIRVVMITGDNGVTAAAIAKQVGIEESGQVCTGAELNGMSDEDLKEKVKTVCIFSRVLPEHKMRIVEAFKANGEIVAMTGDGVNDAPALKYADIGIAMGGRGSEVSREAADMVLLDDNFGTIVDTVRDGRRIYENIRKAIGYIFTIHIPIALTALLAPLLGVAPADLMLLPLHVVLLELVIDPTCSIVFERQPAEHDVMERKPRDPKEGILSKAVLIKSVAQGIVIFLAAFLTYYIAMRTGVGSAAARTMGLCIVILANLALVQVNSSNKDSVFSTCGQLLRDKVIWGINIFTVAGLLVLLYTPLNTVFKFAPLTAWQLLLVAGLSVASVLWYEIVKWVMRRKEM